MLALLLGMSSLIPLPAATPSPYFLDASTVAMIECGDYSGSAFYIGDGKFITAKHMVRNTDKKGWPAMRCTIDKKTVRVIELGKGGIDYAIVSGPIYRPYRAIISCRGFVEGDPYYATGYAEGNPWVVTQRFIASSAHVIMGNIGNYNTILRGSDVAGQSGGPVTDNDGLVVGIVSQGEDTGKTESYILALADTDICKNNRSLN
jgi:V8-like Glu-specific endopeptidase